ncbi:MAG TPA: divergent PAP2 family protein [Candidatus Saccharimonadales bacterium]|nr:divergent PAP2 family protein [Candidatus Saccharimonadales bacterium]
MQVIQISPYLITILLAWVVAHIIKFVISSINKEKRSIRAYLFISGGMPSAHSAAVVAMVTIIGLKNGIGSGLFGLSVLFAIIVMYDAVKVRRSSGEQGSAINKLIKETNSKIKLPRVAKGHTPTEVALGALLGAAIGFVVFLSTM